MSEKSHYEEQFQTRRERRESVRPKKGGGVLEFLIILIVAFTLVFGFVRPYVVEAFWIPSESMVHTLEVGDRVLVNKFIYDFTEPKRGDIVVFKSVEEGPLPPQQGLIQRITGFFTGQSAAAPRREELIKRVVGVPGDKISVQNGRLYVNNELQKEPYVNKDLPDRSFFAPVTVPKNHVFCMGDNRANSRDSRFFGPVPDKNIEGEAFLLFWPLDRISLL
ncbi:MAG TPA: signal peptidase I [Rubrobacteraceae bacterium]|nr:signal peptidase I [Rubrobacteraceae bacterium]